jgi:hypothetical protein
VTTCTTYAWRRRDRLRNHYQVFMKMSLVSGDDTVTVKTGLKLIYSYSVSPQAVTGKIVDYGTVAGGTITLHVTAPGASKDLYVQAIGL